MPPSIPPLTPQPPQGKVVDLRVDRRLLWVGEAAYPLRNVTRVYSVEFKPKRLDRFAWFLGGCALAFLVGNAEPRARVTCVLAATALFAWLLKVLLSPSKYALVIDTSGTASALVTLPDREQLRQLVDAIVEAVENPTKPFHVRVESVHFSRTDYHHGDKVNIYGGLGNTGVLKK